MFPFFFEHVLTVLVLVMQMNLLCCLGCFGCTNSKCYQDKDAVEYYTGNGARVNQEFKSSI